MHGKVRIDIGGALHVAVVGSCWMPLLLVQAKLRDGQGKGFGAVLVAYDASCDVRNDEAAPRLV
jgi:hypothetical protein